MTMTSRLTPVIRQATELKEAGRFEEAINILSNCHRVIAPNAESLSIMVQCHIGLGDIENAFTCQGEAKKLGANTASVGINDARLSLQAGNTSEALALAKKISARFPEDIPCMLLLGGCLRACSQLNESKFYLEKVISLRPNSAEALINRGLIRLAQKNEPGAVSDLGKAHKIKPHIKEIWDLVVSLKIKLGKYEDALIILEGIVCAEPSNGKYNAALAACYQHVGRIDKAVDSYRIAIENNTDNPEIYINMGAALMDQGNIDEAIDSYKQALKTNPDYALAYNNIGVALSERGDLTAAIESYKRALKIQPDYSEVFYNMGIAFNELGNLAAAVESYNMALQIKPNYAKAYNSMGVSLKGQDDLAAAINSYKKAIEINPDYDGAYMNMGNALKDQGNLSAAIDSYKKALEFKPNNAVAHYNMGTVFQKKGDTAASIECYKQAVKIKPDYPQAYCNIANALTGVKISKQDPDLQKIIEIILFQNNYARPKDIAKATISLLKFEPVIKKLFRKNSSRKIEYSWEELVFIFKEVPLFLKLISVCPIPDLEFEEVLTEIRSVLLASVSSLTDSLEVLKLQSALALQCFINEYIFAQTEKETELLKRLEMKVNNEILSGKQPNPQSILCIASYNPLYNYEWKDFVSNNAAIREVFTQQIIEPEKEKKIKPQIPVLNEISDTISLLVKGQYEKNPYPRWITLGLPLAPRSISEIVKEINLNVVDSGIMKTEFPEILTAGCGTGQQSIGTAARFLNSKVLAIDLSLSSLAYAKRKAEELGIKNIEHMQADILDIGKLDRKFDIIESSGVLHHMTNPMIGWKVLSDCLKPGGLMKIGLYSELARQEIIKIRNEISQSDLGHDDATIKLFRNHIIKSNKEWHMRIKGSADFYSLSTVRDLLFHVQEHRFTLPQIQDCLFKLGLVFCGFESHKIVQNFKRANVGPDDPYDLNKWNFYEEANSDSFAGMYQFWCQKMVPGK